MKVGIIGASGYTGGELLKILSRHPNTEIAFATSRANEGKDIGKVHPNLRGVVNMKFEDVSTTDAPARCDFAFLATPHGASMKLAPDLIQAGIKVVDLSGDFRFDDVKVYEKYYNKEHTASGLKAVYGLPELHREKIRKAGFVANPGCYPTSVILGLAPAVKEGIMDIEKIAVDSKSGISGAGIKPTDSSHFPMASQSVLPYKTSKHQHLPEMEQELRRFDPRVKLSFVPHLVPVIRCISSTLHCFLKKDVSSDDLQKIYRRFYKDEPFVRVLDTGEIPRMSGVRGSNYNDIGGFEVDSERGRAIIVSVIDNLIKGAAGQAVQNMNIMMGFDEKAGLESIAMHP